MKNKLMKLGVIIATVFLAFQSVQVAKADHHKHSEYYGGEYEKYKGYDDNDYKKYKDYDDDYKKHKDYDDDWKHEEKYNYSGTQQNALQSYWNIWTRDAIAASSNDNLPFQEYKEVTVQFGDKNEKLLIVPSNGQLLVSGEKMANLLGVKAKFYKESRILELSTDKEELIVRAGTNAAYENMIKTPMPARAMYYEKTVYLPISVICNAFEYRVNWDKNKQVMTIQEFY